MLVAVSAEDEGTGAWVSPHFGRAPGFVLYDSETEEVDFLENTGEHMGGSGKPPDLLADANVDVVLCANLGRRAVAMFNDLGIEVCSGAGETVGEAISAWEADELESATEDGACRGEH